MGTSRTQSNCRGKDAGYFPPSRPAASSRLPGHHAVSPKRQFVIVIAAASGNSFAASHRCDRSYPCWFRAARMALVARQCRTLSRPCCRRAPRHASRSKFYRSSSWQDCKARTNRGCREVPNVTRRLSLCCGQSSMRSSPFDLCFFERETFSAIKSCLAAVRHWPEAKNSREVCLTRIQKV